MPRAQASSTEEETTPKKVAAKKRAPRKTTAKKTAVKKVATKKVVRKKVVKKVVKKTVVRKAPTEGLSEKKRVSINWFYVVPVVAVVLVIAASVAIGMNGAGAINVDSVVAEKIAQREARQKALEAEGNLTELAELQTEEIAPVATARTDVPNGGLRGLGQGAPKPQPVTPVASSTESASSTASSTPETASSTDNGVEDNKIKTTETEGGESAEEPATSESEDVSVGTQSTEDAVNDAATSSDSGV